MKTLVIIAALFASNQVFAQSVSIPDKEFSTKLSKETIELKSTDAQKLEVMILKSKSYQKGKVQMKVSSTLPIGLTVVFSPEKGNFEMSEVTITTNGVAAGEYTLILGATVNYKHKGSILKLKVL
jgi:hypothetical protein